MNALTCADVAGQLELYAAGECDPGTRTAVAAHLHDCPGCTHAAAEAADLLALLDLRAREEDQLARLRRRLSEAPLSRKPTAARLVLRRIAALAALVLLGFGLAALPQRAFPPARAMSHLELALALRPSPPRVQFAEKPLAESDVPADVRAVDAPHGWSKKEATPSFRLDLGGKAPAEFRAAVAAGERPPPPKVPLRLRLRNDGPGDVTVWPGGEDFGVRLTLQGPGAVTVLAPDKPGRPTRKVTPVTAAPKQKVVVPVGRLMSRYGGRTWFHYWTEPGEYTLRAQVTVQAARGSEPPRVLTLDSGSVKIRVDAPR
jgi:hypothetical protein